MSSQLIRVRVYCGGQGSEQRYHIFEDSDPVRRMGEPFKSIDDVAKYVRSTGGHLGGIVPKDKHGLRYREAVIYEPPFVWEPEPVLSLDDLEVIGIAYGWA